MRPRLQLLLLHNQNILEGWAPAAELYNRHDLAPVTLEIVKFVESVRRIGSLAEPAQHQTIASEFSL